MPAISADVQIMDASSASGGHWPSMHIEHATATRTVKGEVGISDPNVHIDETVMELVELVPDAHVGKLASDVNALLPAGHYDGGSAEQRGPHAFAGEKFRILGELWGGRLMEDGQGEW